MFVDADLGIVAMGSDDRLPSKRHASVERQTPLKAGASNQVLNLVDCGGDVLNLCPTQPCHKCLTVPVFYANARHPFSRCTCTDSNSPYTQSQVLVVYCAQIENRSGVLFCPFHDLPISHDLGLWSAISLSTFQKNVSISRCATLVFRPCVLLSVFVWLRSLRLMLPGPSDLHYAYRI